MIGYDYTERIAPAALKAAGCSAVFRYVMPQTPYWVKALRNPEAAELLAAGFPIVSNFESSANRMLGGASAGHDDAVQLVANWKALGAPAGLIGWFSADWDVQASEVPAVLAYLNAAASVLGGKKFVGCYGGLRAVSAAMDAGFGGWQTVAWSGGKWDPRAVARQIGTKQNVGGVDADVNEIANLAALGAWGGPTIGDDMPLTQADVDAVVNGVLAKLPTATAQATYRHGEESVNQNGKAVPNVPLGNLAHGSWVALNDPAGAIPQMRSQLNDLFHRPVFDPAALTAALTPMIEQAIKADLPADQIAAQIAAAVPGHLTLTVGTK